MSQTECIVVEHAFGERKQFDEVKGVCARRSYLSLDGKAMVSVYDAGDVESVRETQRIAGISFARIWRAFVMARGEAVCAPPGRSTVIVERGAVPGLRKEQLPGLMTARKSCFQTNGVELLCSYLAEDASRIICIFSALDAEAVRRANREGELPFTRAWAATHHG
jgi:hypothetical protein